MSQTSILLFDAALLNPLPQTEKLIVVIGLSFFQEAKSELSPTSVSQKFFFPLNAIRVVFCRSY